MVLLGKIVSSNEEEQYSIIERTSADEDIAKVHRKHKNFIAHWRHFFCRERFPKRLLAGDLVRFRPVTKNGTAFAHAVHIVSVEQAREIQRNERERGEFVRQAAEIKGRVWECEREPINDISNVAKAEPGRDKCVSDLLADRARRRRGGIERDE